MSYGEYKDLWCKLLSNKRFAFDKEKKELIVRDPGLEEFRTPFEADIGRIVFSQPFRRLAGKTQVHPFSEVDYIHNRLTRLRA